MADEWYRSREWDERDFESRLARSGAGNRPQYLRIKALALLQGDDDRRFVAIRLLQRLEAEYGDDYIQSRLAPEDLGQAYELVGRNENAASAYDVAVERQIDSNVHGQVPFRLAELVLRANLEDRYARRSRFCSVSRSRGAG